MVVPNRGALAVKDLPELRVILDRLSPSGLLAVLLFGSVARGEANEQSDVDVLVVVDSEADRAQTLSGLRSVAQLESLPLVFTKAALLDERMARPSFIAHLIDEGIELYSTAEWHSVRAALQAAAADKDALSRELETRARSLELFRDPARHEFSPITALSHIYALGRSLVIVRLLQNGIHEFAWQDVFDRYAEIRPELRKELAELQSLRPFYEFARDRTQVVPRMSGMRRDVITRMATAVEEIAS